MDGCFLARTQAVIRLLLRHLAEELAVHLVLRHHPLLRQVQVALLAVALLAVALLAVARLAVVRLAVVRLVQVAHLAIVDQGKKIVLRPLGVAVVVTNAAVIADAVVRQNHVIDINVCQILVRVAETLILHIWDVNQL